MHTRTCSMIVGLTAALVAMSVASAAVIYVDDSAMGNNDGTCWADAYVDLMLALDGATTGDEIRVAGGVYRPAGPDGNRAASFSIDAAVNVLGGYAGCGAEDPDVRDTERCATILSGDLNGDDASVDAADLPGEVTRSDNSYHVVRVGPFDGEAVIDGCTITGGNANGAAYADKDGGGVLGDYRSGHLKLSHCVIEDNSVVYNGGGVMFRGDMDGCLVRNNCAGSGGGLVVSGLVSDCIVENNVATKQGGGVAVNGQPHMVDCVIRNNTSALRGGGLSTVYGDPLIERCIFTGNHAETDGGAVYSYNCDTCTGYPRFYQCLFTGNSAGERGGAVYEGGITEIWLVNCTVFGNTAGQTGGVYIVPSHGQWWLVGNCIIWGNADTADMGTLAAQICPTGMTETETGGFAFCCIEGWSASPGTSVNTSIGDNPLFVDASGLNLRLLLDSPCIDAGNDGFYPAATTDPPAGTGGGHVPDATDLDGNSRFVGRSVDIGAHEFPSITVWYVQADANSVGADGASWETALAYLQDALMLVPEGGEIRIAQGMYRPGDFVLSDRPNFGRAETFALAAGVTIKGGYAGLGAPDPDARDIRRYETILSGDLRGTLPALTRENYEAVLTGRGRGEYANCYHVVSATGVDGTAVLDGVTITGGTANGPGFGESAEPEHFRGGGVYVEDAAATFIDCTITGNIAYVCGGPTAAGGGMYCKLSQPKLIRCSFVFNWADDDDSDAYGGGMMNEDSSPVLVDCVFQNNGTWNWGGAMANSNSSVTMTRCDFLDNRAQYGGGAIWHASSGENVLAAKGCLFAGNRSMQPGGAVSLAGGGGTFENCTFAENRVGDYGEGPAVACGWGVREFNAVNCIFRDGGEEFLLSETVTPEVTFSNVEGGFAGQGNVDVDPLFARWGRWQSPGTSHGFYDAWVGGDYHLKSQAGRWDGGRAEWVRDNVTSPCIDAGNPRSLIMHEPTPNGGVVNMGAYGGTTEASKTYFEGFVCEVVTVGDLNGDCLVGLVDLALMAGHWMEDNRISATGQ